MNETRFYNKVKEFEGCRLKAYQAPEQKGTNRYTIGYGHAIGVIKDDTITLAVADKLLKDDFRKIFQNIDTLYPQFKLLATHERYAIADFVFNLGIGRFRRSSVPRLVLDYVTCSPEQRNIKSQLITAKLDDFIYCTVGSYKKILRGLKLRRQFEIDVWNGLYS